MRWILLACGPLNLAGAISFSPPFPAARAPLGLPEPHPFYLWLIATWILAFGVAYFYQGWTGTANRAVLALGAVGKGSFGLLLTGMAAMKLLPPSAAAASALDLILAVIIAGWLWRTRQPGHA